MTEEQNDHMQKNVAAFQQGYIPKYVNGQREHHGNMWTMGAYQAYANARDEVLDQWSYIQQFRKCLDEINLCETIEEVREILTRAKFDEGKEDK
jgi:hypothetical protein